MLFVFGAFVLIAGFFVFEEHRAHLLGMLPYVLVLAALFLALLGYAGPRRHRKGGAR